VPCEKNSFNEGATSQLVLMPRFSGPVAASHLAGEAAQRTHVHAEQFTELSVDGGCKRITADFLCCSTSGLAKAFPPAAPD